jgi:hypothetical protein
MLGARARGAALGALAAALCTACGLGEGTLVISEVMSDNEGAWVDDHGEADDYIELANLTGDPVNAADFALQDASGMRVRLPALQVAPHSTLTFAADDTPEQGALHLPFKISSQGDTLYLEHRESGEIERIDVPALAVNEAFVRLPDGLRVCRYASPERQNGDACGPPPPPELKDDVRFSRFEWPEPWPEPAGPLVLSELALSPARFVEVLNTSEQTVELASYALRVAPHAPAIPWPGASDGVALAWPVSTLAAGARIAVAVGDADVAQIAQDPAFEGVVTLFAVADEQVVDRIDFMRWPQGAALTRVPDASGHPRFCAAPSEGEPNEPCDPLASRDVGDRVRHLYTPGDFDALADGDTSLTTRGVKFVVDMEAGDVVHLLSNSWALHYTFIRERIDGDPPLDRCDPAESAMFNSGWGNFSDLHYFRVEGRRYLLGTLNEHAGSGMHTVDFALGDAISGEQMLRAFFDVMAHVDEPRAWALRPAEPDQLTQMSIIEGRAPIVGPNAPFQELRYQPLTEAVGFGVLEFVPSAELEQAALGRDVIVVTDDVPNDIPLVGGLITEAFQTPLAHVNVLSKNRGTPNMALRDARHAAEIEPLLGELVRLEVSAGGFSLRSATAEEAAEFWQAQDPGGERFVPRSDLSVRGVQPLDAKSLDDLPAIGAKAAQFAELSRVPAACGMKVPVPPNAFALPLVHYVEHFERSGARALLDAFLADAGFRADPVVRAEGLAQIRQAVQGAEVDPALLAELEQAVRERFGTARVRLRSSSNTEDLPAFNGAGLYTSLSAAIDDPTRTLQDGLRTVWASLWSPRAYDERELARIEQTEVAMGVLVHEAFLSEHANAVAISRNLLDPTRSEIHYINAQFGEASVANPAPGVVTEQLIHHWRAVPGTPRVEYQSKSSLSRGVEVMSYDEIRRISCQLDAIHKHFRKRLDPMRQNRWFAVDIELKLIGDDRRLLIKQARPYSFGRADVPVDCRET